MGVTSKMCGGDYLLWRVVISSSSGSWIDISALSFCVVLIVSVLSFCVYRALSHSVSVLIVVLCLFVLVVRCFILFLCSLCLCSRFVSVCVCLLVHSVLHRAFARIVLRGIVLHLRFCAHFFLVLCLFACLCLFVLCHIVEET